MPSLPPLLRDFLAGLLIVTAVLLVVDVVGAGAPREDRWVLLPVGAALFAMRQGVRRAVTRRTGPDAAGPDAGAPGAAAPGAGAPGAPGTGSPARPDARPGRADGRAGRPSTAARVPRATSAWNEDPVRVLGLAVLAVLGLLALAFYG